MSSTEAVSSPREDQSLQEMYVEVGFHSKEAWKSAPAVFEDGTLKILGHPVMEDWERPYMKKLAEIASSNGGTVLEVGFGMGISANFIQSATIDRHIIVEANGDVAKRAREFGRTARHPVTVHEGLWEDVISEIPDGSVDGILYDAYPLEECEIMNQARFADTAFKKLRPGGVFTYFSDESEWYQEDHFETLLKAGFARENIDGVVIKVTPPDTCQYWKHQSILAPRLVA